MCILHTVPSFSGRIIRSSFDVSLFPGFPLEKVKPDSDDDHHANRHLLPEGLHVQVNEPGLQYIDNKHADNSLAHPADAPEHAGAADHHGCNGPKFISNATIHMGEIHAAVYTREDSAVMNPLMQ